MAKFAVGDAVVVDGVAGTIVEVGVHDDHWLSSGFPQQYSVRLTPWRRYETEHPVAKTPVVVYLHPEGQCDDKGRILWRDHEADTLGCVPEGAILSRSA